MAIERKFVADNIKKLQVKEYMEKELDRAGCGKIEIQRTPMGTRVIVDAQRPGLVIGRKGQAIRKMTNALKKKFALDNPQIEVNELDVPELNAQVMAESIASSIERGIHFRRAAYTALRKIMEAGARGTEISISGKLTGDRSKSLKFVDGYLKHCGEPAILYVRRGLAQAFPKAGVIGVKVKIMPPGVVLPDDIEYIEEKEKKKAETTPVKDEIEELVVDIVEEVGTGEEAPKKKIKPEKVKRKKAKKKVAEEEEPELEGEGADAEDEVTAPEVEEEKAGKKEKEAPKKKPVKEGKDGEKKPAPKAKEEKPKKKAVKKEKKDEVKETEEGKEKAEEKKEKEPKEKPKKTKAGSRAKKEKSEEKESSSKTKEKKEKK